MMEVKWKGGDKSKRRGQGSDRHRMQRNLGLCWISSTPAPPFGNPLSSWMPATSRVSLRQETIASLFGISLNRAS